MRRIESLGYDVLVIPDHFREQLAPLPALAAAATLTERIRLGTLVLSNDYRHPAVLAKEAATVDVLSGGRFELGLGAGWAGDEYRCAGLDFDTAGRRLERMFESVTVLKGLFAGDSLHFEGEHYRIEGLEGRPRPVQRPHPPLLIGGGGPRVLKFAAQEADIVGINVDLRSGQNLNPRSRQFGPASGEAASGEATAKRVDWVRSAAGERFEALELNVRVYISEITDQRVLAARPYAKRLGIDAVSLLESPHVLIGNHLQLVEDLIARRQQYGISYVVVGEDIAEGFAPVVESLGGS